jgi:hypothetical protein
LETFFYRKKVSKPSKNTLAKAWGFAPIPQPLFKKKRRKNFYGRLRRRGIFLILPYFIDFDIFISIPALAIMNISDVPP